MNIQLKNLQACAKISQQKQARHIKGTFPFNKSYLDSIEDAQKVLDAYNSGQAQLISRVPTTQTVIILVKNVSGTYVNRGNPNGLPDRVLPTNVFEIQSRNSPKVVPLNPDKGQNTNGGNNGCNCG